MLTIEDTFKPSPPFDPEKYILSQELTDLIRVAMVLNKPILLTGEPGTGKTLLAHKIATELYKLDNKFTPYPIVFNTKTTSTASDLFYTYDAVRHFYDANVGKHSSGSLNDIGQYITLQALGLAIARSSTEEIAAKRFIKDDAPSHSVLLIDEIDKAPRDFSNDILNEIDKFEFSIKEADNYSIKKDTEAKLLVVMTSNSEKNLPDAFLRRCIFYHIPFPDKEQLQAIISANLDIADQYADDQIIEHFTKIRELVIKKKPATAELLSWLKILELEQFVGDGQAVDFNNLTDHQKRVLKLSYPILIKTTEDLQRLQEVNFLQ